jgi:hypothetical protein
MQADCICPRLTTEEKKKKEGERQMKKFLLFVFALSLALAHTTMALEPNTPQCHLGTAWAIKPERKVETWEKSILTPAGVIADVTQRETPGSSHIVIRRCELPEKTEVIYGGVGGPWIRKCGNAMSNIEGWTIPIELPMGPRGYKGDKGDRGERGPKGDQGETLVIVRPWHDPCTRTITQKYVCSAAVIAFTSFIVKKVYDYYQTPPYTCQTCR